MLNLLKQWFPWLFDFSQGEQKDQQFARTLTGILQVALLESETDAGFEQCFRQLIKATDGLAEESTWVWLNCRLSDYRRAAENTPMPRTLAARFLKDIPKRYGIQVDSTTTGQQDRPK